MKTDYNTFARTIDDLHFTIDHINTTCQREMWKALTEAQRKTIIEGLAAALYAAQTAQDEVL